MWKKSNVYFIKAEHPLIMAHRGDSANVPENTMLAFEEAYKLKVDVIETDVHITKDLKFVFFHDDKLNRVTEGRGFLRKYTLLDLKKLNLGYKFRDLEGNYPYRNKKLEICTLEEVLDRFKDVKFNMDIKDKDKRVPKLLALKLKEMDVEKRVQVGSFHQSQINRFRYYSECPTSAGPNETLNFWRICRKYIKKNQNEFKDLSFQKSISNEPPEYFENLQKQIFGYKLPYVSLTVPERFGLLKIISPKSIKFAHKIGIAVYVWTINKETDMIRLLKWSVDGIFTDKPSLLKKILIEKFNFVI
ncbi:MAG: glycerophosphodiester phosphodiesterase [Promethearchaeota archaeon]